jgi:hypothetical protein
LHPAEWRAAGGQLLAPPGWLLDAPVALGEVRLAWSDSVPAAVPLGPLDHVLPLADGGERYTSYSQAVGERPDRLRGGMSSGIGTLTIRRDPGGGHRFVLHERDSAAVACGGGLWSLIPTGEFQPCTAHPADVRNDFSIWRNIVRELAEEFLGHPEHGPGTPRLINYAEQEPFGSFERARAAGRLRLWHYGLTLDPLTLGPTQRTVAVVEADAFDELFAGMVTVNDEGRVIRMDGRVGAPFTAEAIGRLEPRLSAGASSTLHLAWRDRDLLLG